MIRPPTPLVRHLLRAALVGTFALAPGNAAQPGQSSAFGNITVPDFKVPEWYPPPNQNQLKWLWTGSNAVTQGSITRVLVNQVTLATYAITGEQDLLVQADSCFFDTTRKTASSDGRIKVQAARGRMTLEGTGFSWQGSNSILTISNNIHIEIKRGASGPTPSRP